MMFCCSFCPNNFCSIKATKKHNKICDTQIMVNYNDGQDHKDKYMAILSQEMSMVIWKLWYLFSYIEVITNFNRLIKFQSQEV